MKTDIEKQKEIKSNSLANYIGKKIIIDYYIKENHKYIIGKLKAVSKDKREIEVMTNTKQKIISFNNIYAVYEA